MLQKTYNLLDFLMRHSFHYWVWTFCLLFLVFDKVLHMPLELLSHFNFIPEYLLNLSKVINTKPEEIPATVSNLNVVVDIKEILSALSQINQNLVSLNENISNLNIKMAENHTLVQSNINMILETSRVMYNNNQLLNENIVAALQETNSLIKTDTEAQIKIAKRLVSIFNESNNVLDTINSNFLSINKPILSIHDSLNQILINQKDLYIMYQNIQDVNLQNYNLFIETQNANFVILQENIEKIFSKINEVRNHNIELYRKLDLNITSKFEGLDSKIVNQVIDELNRPKISSTNVSASNKSWTNFFDKK